MGLYDRDYARAAPDETPSRFRPTALQVLLGLNAAVFLAWLLGGPGFGGFLFANFTLSWPGVAEGYRLHTVLTYSISHRDLWHFILNMFFLWVFGREAQAAYGSRRFALLYVFAALLAAGLHLAISAWRGSDVPMLGASGAAMGVAIACACLFPNQVVYFWGLFPLKLKWMALLFIVLDLLGAADQRTMVAHWAHLGGALGGYLFYRWNSDGVGETGVGFSMARLRRFFRRRPRLRLVNRPTPEEAEPVFDKTLGGRVDAETAERVDKLLEKIQQQGMAALTDAEREFLRSASEKYRRPGQRS